MTEYAASHAEPLTLYTTDHLGMVYDRDVLLREHRLGNLARLRVDRHIAKVLPAGSVIHVEPARDGMVRVVASAYRPFYRKDLFALGELIRPCRRAPVEPPPSLPAPEQVLATLRSLAGTPYLYGGSAVHGSASQARALIARGLLRESDRRVEEFARLLTSRGLDCSGLFNVATAYAFFGDSRDLYHLFDERLRHPGAEVADDPAALAERLRPLDIILFRGHLAVSLGAGQVIQAVGDGINASTFALETGFTGAPMAKYNRVVIDDAAAILRALMVRQGRRLATRWCLDDRHFMLVGYPGERVVGDAPGGGASASPGCDRVGVIVE